MGGGLPGGGASGPFHLPDQTCTSYSQRRMPDTMMDCTVKAGSAPYAVRASSNLAQGLFPVLLMAAGAQVRSPGQYSGLRVTDTDGKEP